MRPNGMRPPGHGTIIFGNQRTEFVTLAADQSLSFGDIYSPAESPPRIERKILHHPKLPMAVAITGMATLHTGTPPDPGPQVTVKSIISGVLLTLADVADLRIENLGRLFRDALLDFTIHTRINLAVHGRESNRFVDLLLARWIDDHPSLIRITIGSQLIFGDEIAFMLWPPDPVKPFYDRWRESAADDYFGSNLRTSEELARHARSLIEGGIAYERTLYGGMNRACGGDVDVVVIDAAGARLIGS